ncbi:MAG: ribonuclease Y [Candidatus Yonathbacteria bacterium CG10_big_fil_rev_8_21_14_0_10_43_136]|uniref:Ribonuclease Y n=2 Tax=Parcubacteria group TaxID=1794811 RepID=A0A2M7Q5G3_9BACT|nr:MAG: ribonuclease Y [Candidatus Nomurabacteria bacterium CG2_30_43_9]PIQ36042.1 MAG: ribonuclease Y [Candidatus Yonathbacteria bacterium CG17_big_fil_post_rev_8_21_14_2_50_43_9]PIR40390.1 MAG: ribonuclease Y [Candidatus Yonathbacteria bacterium CG10_big_fil_rev_8_21_14_0_10_43_136]PIY58194.1 MAG: ribonuclease Y [Candidatus Yonathbacteria bacterium CG_4_10_14_0_8_um_filter_43_17]PJC21998.1 MAG: ribonuclease Y [Candidatus Yonathbacteria bacterium CG_4_9_14_0_2_um_filter_43_16]
MDINIALTLGGVMAILVGMALGYLLRLIVAMSRKGSVEIEVKQVLLSAKEEAQKIIEEADRRAEVYGQELHEDEREQSERFKKLEERLAKKEEFLDKRQLDIDSEVAHIKEKAEELRVIREKTNKENEFVHRELERVALLSTEDAKEELVKRVEKTYEGDLLARIKKLETNGENQLAQKARDILATAIQRLATSTAAEMMVTSVPIPSDEIKGKIIGKEGRNIRAFERSAGVEVIVDDTPGSIIISSFDPIRRQIARAALESLIDDGRIQPARIEEAVEKAREDINKITKEKGEKAVYDCGVFNLDPRVIAILGRLYFRTSYGQNVLQHSIEMAHIAGMIAEEVGGNVVVAKTGALLHDIGKAVDHEVQGTHVEIGRKILKKFGVDQRVIQAMQSHHEEYPYETLESIIVQTADSISGGRPGARRDSAENYIKRLEDLEGIAKSFPVVEKTYAIQAGRELRVFVKPEEISDLDAKKLARDIAIRVESELKYPGEIKVAVIRESRAIEYAR